jgi:hypothetical protein
VAPIHYTTYYVEEGAGEEVEAEADGAVVAAAGGVAVVAVVAGVAALVSSAVGESDINEVGV